MSAKPAVPIAAIAPDAAATADQRDCERSSFIADIEFFDIDRGGTVLVGRTSDLSCGGCYVDCLCPVPLDAQFRVRIAHDGQAIEAVGLVVYSQPGSGVGVSFTYMAPQHRSILDGWLCQLRGEAGPVRVSAEGARAQQVQRPEREVLADLVALLLRRGVLSLGDGNRLLRELSSFAHPPR